ncbi:MAG: LacI family transcriptional regulator [Clostridiales bacterium]|nr:LacI family transcriptional regulator [Clostridiales bacterium]
MENNKSKRNSRVTIKDVAKAADVSIATVSYVLNNKQGQSICEDTRKKVLQFANLLGYECNVMAKYLATGKSNTVAAVFNNVATLAAPYYFQLLTELSRLLNRQNISLAVVDYADACRGNSVCDAYIAIAVSESEFRRFADAKYVPVLAIDCVFEDFLFFRVNDDFKSLYQTAKREFGSDSASLLTFAMPDECINEAKKHFDDVIVLHDLTELGKLTRDKNYITTSKLIYDHAVPHVSVKLENASFALKASAAANAIIKAVNRVQASAEEHNIKI